MDRVRVLPIEFDAEEFLDYGAEIGIHPIINEISNVILFFALFGDEGRGLYESFYGKNFRRAEYS